MGGRILIVDDDIDIRVTLTHCLSMMGYTVRTAIHGRDALDILRGWRPDVVLLDSLMPVMGGLGFLRNRQADPLLRTIPVLVMAARMNLRDVPRGADGVITKPFALDQLVHQVNSLMSPRMSEVG